MPIRVDMPDGSVRTFPDDATPEQITAVLSAEAPEEPSGAWLGDPVRGAVQGLTLGFSDEIAGLVGASGALLSGDDAGEAYTESRDMRRRELAETQRRSPWLYGGAQGAGALWPGARIYKGMSAIKGLAGRTVPRLMATGAVEGAAFGAGESDAESTLGRLAGAGLGAATGAAVAPIGYGIGKAASEGLGYVGRKIGEQFMSSPEDVAKRTVRRALDAEGLTLGAARDLIDESPEMVAADLGPNMRALANYVADRQGPGKKIATEFLTGRQAGQQMRIESKARETIGDKWGTFNEFTDNIVSARRAQAGPLYEEAYQQGIRITPGMQDLMRAPAFQTAVGRARRNLANDIELTGGGGPGEPGMMSTRFFDLVKRELWDMEYAAGKGTNEARLYGNIRRRLVGELDTQNPVYAQARNTFAGASDLEDAATLGRDMLRGQKTLDDMSRQTRGFTDGEMEAFRVGALDAIVRQTQLAGGTHDATKRLVNSTRAKQLIMQAFPDANAYDDFIEMLEREAQYVTTNQRVLGNSATAGRLSAQQDIEAGEGMTGLVTDVATGMPGAYATSRAIQRMMQRNFSAEDLEEISKLLFGHIPLPQRPRLSKYFLDDEASKIVGRAAGYATVPATVETVRDLRQ